MFSLVRLPGRQAGGSRRCIVAGIGPFFKEDAMSSGNPHRTMIGQLATILTLVTDGRRKIEEVTKYLERQFSFTRLRSEDLYQILVEQVKWILERLSSNPGEAEEMSRTLQKVIADPDFFVYIRSQITKQMKATSLLKFVGSGIGSETICPRRRASELFVKDTSGSAEVKIQVVDTAFVKRFGEMFVGLRNGRARSYYKLRRKARDHEIQAALGGNCEYVSTLDDLWWFMKQQPNGKGDVLLADGSSNIFYIFDDSSELCTVIVVWIGSGWCVYAVERDYYHWDMKETRRIFSQAQCV